MTSSQFRFYYLTILTLLILSGIFSLDKLTWFLETIPVFIALPVLIYTYNQFKLSKLLYVLIFIHCLILMVGGIYTYAEVPLGYIVEHILDLDRNPYDKLGHFFQGLVPALIAREILLRKIYIKPGKLLFFVCISIVMFISSSYEIFEWAMAEILGQGADEFLGTQGYIWDTQSDMLSALIGGIFSLTFLAPIQDREINKTTNI